MKTPTFVAFEVALNKKKLCLAGIAGDCVLSTYLAHAISTKHGNRWTNLRVGGLSSERDEHVEWKSKPLKVGDEVHVKVVRVSNVDTPTEVRKRDPKAELANKKRYVRSLAKQLGWTITVHPAQTKRSGRPSAVR